MKIKCECGATIFDSTDDLPNKAHLLPDQGWCTMWDALDNDLDLVAAGQLTSEAASMKIRQNFTKAGARLMWQCESCGRLYLDGKDGALQCFTPSSLETDKESLRMWPAR
jgi:hypothetical protein